MSMETFSRGTLDPWYVSGFIDGEGTFTYSRSGKQLVLYFAVKRSMSDRPLLEMLQAFFLGIGRMYPTETGVASEMAAKSACYYRITRQKDLEQVITHIEQYPLQTSKAECYAIWREMVFLKRSFRKPPRVQLDELARKLSEASRRLRT